MRVIGAQRCYIQTAIHPCNSAVAKEWQRLGTWHFLIGGQQCARIADGKQSRSRPAAGLRNDLSLTVALLPNSQAIRHHRECDPIGQGYKISSFQGSIPKGERLQAGFLAYFSLRSAIKQVWNGHRYPYYGPNMNLVYKKEISGDIPVPLHRLSRNGLLTLH